ncbi:hypothetical protein POF50_027875 [Streptomyces sp. SL13]|uniref:Uncharacterized protein n=1 Tax=Streptantibioticus silvisoli TaxID=2705255 RepID=A0AA90H470_9ACTN|nr:hypothetical protein [Streptantibioticus silvisoli]MDI5973119.1 hypothetical protein [Streptantibioticus silvisoli]
MIDAPGVAPHDVPPIGRYTPAPASDRLRRKVPFITAWSGEVRAQPRLVWRGDRIGFANERPRDRDAFGVLWRRAANKPGQGKPLFGTTHAGRQRRAMGGLLCQVCGTPTRPEATDDGVLFLLSRTDYEWQPWPAPIKITHPPVCIRCVPVSLSACPHLRDDYVGIRCRAPRLYGVSGVMHMPRSGPVPIPDATHPIGTLPFADTRIGLIHAAQLVVKLDHYTLVDLSSELSAPPRRTGHSRR